MLRDERWCGCKESLGGCGWLTCKGLCAYGIGEQGTLGMLSGMCHEGFHVGVEVGGQPRAFWAIDLGGTSLGQGFKELLERKV